MGHDGTQEDRDYLIEVAVNVGIIRNEKSERVNDLYSLARSVVEVCPDFESPYLDAPPPADDPDDSDDVGDIPVERKKPTAKKKPKPPKTPKPTHNGGRFVMIYDHDVNRILGCGDKSIASKTLAVWYTLVKRAEDEKSLTFDMPDGYIATTIPGMRSRHTVRKVTALLQSLGMLVSESFADSGNFRTELRRTISPAGKLRGCKEKEQNPFA